MSRYPDETREKALKMMDELGATQTSKRMNIGKQTLYQWRKEQRKNAQLPAMIGKQNSDMNNPANNPENHTKDNNTIYEIEKKLQTELEDMQHHSQMADKTIDYLIAENRQLRQRCERYLEVISLLSQ